MNPASPSYLLTPHFRLREFACHDGTPVANADIEAVRWLCVSLLEPLRARFGPVTILSGFRTPRYNASVGGAPESYHRYDLRRPSTTTRGAGAGPAAADVVCRRGSPEEWQVWIRAGVRGGTLNPGRGRGTAQMYHRQGFVHVDTGPTRSWAT